MLHRKFKTFEYDVLQLVTIGSDLYDCSSYPQPGDKGLQQPSTHSRPACTASGPSCSTRNKSIVGANALASRFIESRNHNLKTPQALASGFLLLSQRLVQR
ncbi:hypothetical protein EVAR_53326_1 [Eumeta japonica]|uniref:Uncharacterized protein n=1 Tax=Eumeta variegata TaxID=151549 RepID=A0A4C1X8F5_EUMVA|nr:hypothetical protein EVAR_53326_1 [Eumeta japonica]